jgi:dTDP-4-amino-4,6-dideoxygalactose transaminase
LPPVNYPTDCYKGQSAGSFGLGGCISFYPAKVLGCFGDGGAVLTNNKDIYNKWSKVQSE